MATTSIGAPGVVFPDGSTQASATTGVPVLNVYTSTTPGQVWSKPTGLRAIKVTVVGGGGNGGSMPAPATSGAAAGGGGGGAAVRTYPAASIPGPQPFTVGGATAASSFGGSVSVITGTAGGTGSYSATPAGNPAGAGGSGSGGQLNVRGSSGQAQSGGNAAVPQVGGGSMLGGSSLQFWDNSPQSGQPGSLYGGGGGGASKNNQAAGANSGGTGAQGVVIVEEFY